MRRIPLNADHTRPHGSDGSPLDLESWAHSYNHNPDGSLNYIEVTDGISTWRQTWTWTAGKLTGTSGWVKQ